MPNDTIPGFTPTPLPTQSNSPTGATKPLGPPGLVVYDKKTKTYSIKPIGVTQTNPATNFPTPSGQHLLGPSTTQFGTTANDSAYTATDAWNVPFEQGPSIKAGLIQAGLLNPKDFGTGAWDFNSAAAYQKVLEFANTYGLTAQDALSYFEANPQGDTTGAAGPTIAFTNPQDIATSYQNTSQQLTGQEQDPSQFQGYYHGLEAAQAHDTGQNYTQAPSLTGAATQYVQNNMPGQEIAYGVASRMNDFFQMVGQ